MKSKVLGYIFFVHTLSFSVQLPSRVEEKRGRLQIYRDDVRYDTAGYGNCNGLTNGEHLIIQSFIKKGDTVIDTGAYIGEWSQLVLTHTQNQCDLYAFEPIPQSYTILAETLRNKARYHNVALGDKDEVAAMNFFYERGADCSSLYVRRVLSHVPVKQVNVRITFLDKFCVQNHIDHINFLKIDTEGYEWKVLQGANDLITQKKIDIIQFEYGGTYPDAEITLFQVFTYLTSKGYALFRIVPNGLIFTPRWRKELETNLYSNYLAVLK